MEFLLKTIGDTRLEKLCGCINYNNTDQFKSIQKQFPEYDRSFLWLLSYQREGAPPVLSYIEKNYKKFHQTLDSRFLKKLSSKGNFESHMWEMIVCDILSSAGELIPKEKSGADFLLNMSGKHIQIEAVAPDESIKEELRAIRPDYSKNNTFEFVGNLEDVERPILLRVFDGIKAKKDKYRKDLPLIIAVNSSKVVGLSSRDEYILRRILFGLGFNTISKEADGSYRNGLQYNPLLSKPGGDLFPVAIFRNPDYSHVSGIIYTSQRSQDLVPGGDGWLNYGITYVRNPDAKIDAQINLPCLRRIECTEESYEEIESRHEFKSSVF